MSCNPGGSILVLVDQPARLHEQFDQGIALGFQSLFWWISPPSSFGVLEHMARADFQSLFWWISPHRTAEGYGSALMEPHKGTCIISRV